jgi:hypothetical protein
VKHGKRVAAQILGHSGFACTFVIRQFAWYLTYPEMHLDACLRAFKHMCIFVFRYYASELDWAISGEQAISN